MRPLPEAGAEREPQLGGGYPVSEGLSWYLASLVLAGGASFLAFLCWPCLLSSVSYGSSHALLLDFLLSFWYQSCYD